MLLRGNETLLRGNEMLLRGNVISFRGNDILLRGNEILFWVNVLIYRGNEMHITWEWNAFRGKQIIICVIMSPPGLRKILNSCEIKKNKQHVKFLFPRIAGWHRNGLGSFSTKIIAYKGRPFSVFVDGFVSHFPLLQLYSNHLILSFSKHRGRIEWWQPSWISWCARTRKMDI